MKEGYRMSIKNIGRFKGCTINFETDTPMNEIWIQFEQVDDTEINQQIRTLSDDEVECYLTVSGNGAEVDGIALTDDSDNSITIGVQLTDDEKRLAVCAACDAYREQLEKCIL